MIKQGNTKLEFGTGSIRCCFGGEKGRGALLLKQGEPTKIGSYKEAEICDKRSYVNPDDFPVVMFFSNTESIDAVIDSLKIVREIVEGTFDTPSGEAKS
jgi:hypothetical protein